MSEELFSVIEIEVNHACNRSCSYCPNDQFERKSKGEINPQLLLKLLTELSSLHFTGRVSFSFYNEPLLHSDFVSVVRKTRAALPASSLELYSNGTLLSSEKISALIEAGINKFIITRHESDLKNPKYKFHEIFQKLCMEQKKYFEYRDFDQVKLFNRGGLLKHLGESLTLLPCHIPSHMVTVTVAGHVLPCFEDFNEEQVMGDLNVDTLWKIWHSEKYQNFRGSLKKGLRHQFKPCDGCNRSLVLPPF